MTNDNELINQETSMKYQLLRCSIETDKKIRRKNKWNANYYIAPSKMTNNTSKKNKWNANYYNAPSKLTNNTSKKTVWCWSVLIL